MRRTIIFQDREKYDIVIRTKRLTTSLVPIEIMQTNDNTTVDGGIQTVNVARDNFAHHTGF